MLLWTFETYVGPSSRNDVQETIDNYDDYARAAFERAVMHLAASPKNQWNEPHSKKLKNEDPLYEIIYKANRRQERAIGFFDDDRGVFVIVAIGYHKERVYHPHGLFKQGHRRASQIGSGEASTAPLQIDGEDFPPDDE